MSHETTNQERRRRDRTDDRAQGELVAYEDENGNALAWTGDDEAPYVRVLPADDDPLEVQGDVANDAVDSGNPVKIGGVAASGPIPASVAVGDRVNALFDIFGKLGTIPWASETNEVVLRADLALAAAGAFVVTTVIDVRGYRRLNLTIRYAPGAVNGRPHIVPFRAKTEASPALNSDSWSTFGVNDGSVASVNLTGALAVGTIITAQPQWGEVTNAQLVLTTRPGIAASDRIREDVELDVQSVKWVYLQVAEVGATATPGILGLTYNLSA